MQQHAKKMNCKNKIKKEMTISRISIQINETTKDDERTLSTKYYCWDRTAACINQTVKACVNVDNR